MKLITRSDFDGLVCAVLLKEVEQIDQIEFAHPKDVQDGRLKVTSEHILTNLPYIEGVGLWFDHHSSETDRLDSAIEYQGACEMAPSAARVVYNYYKDKTETLKKFDDLLAVVDRYDAAKLTEEDIRKPSGWTLLAFVMDPRTGLGYHHEYGISNRDLMMKMIDLIRYHTKEEILGMPDVKARVDRYFAGQKEFNELQKKHSKQIKNLVVTDLRGVKVPAGNRFSIYLLYPKANISLRIFDGKKGEFIVVAGGYSIFNKTAKTDLGELFARYGGGGHKVSATCQLAIEGADKNIQEMIDQITSEG